MTSTAAENTEAHTDSRSGRHFWWTAAACLIVLAAAIALRVGTSILHKGPVFDEKFITAPIVDLIELGWSVETAIDFRETKGPGMVWPYAIINQFIGHDLNDIRLTSVGFFVAGFFPLCLLAMRCRMRGIELALVAIGYVLLPYHAILAQLVMSESSFVCGASLLMLIVALTIGRTSSAVRVAGLCATCILLSILLHHRVHAVAFAGAICLTALFVERGRSWPWWVACVIAGVSRIPLWVRWGGLVSPEFQGPHTLGLSVESLAYLGATLTPFLGVLLVYVLAYRRRFTLWWLPMAGMGIGLVLSLVAMPDLQQRLPLLDSEVLRYQGIAATLVRRLAGETGLFSDTMLAGLMMIGLGGLGGLAAIAFNRSGKTTEDVVCQLCFWSFACGWLLYLLTGSVVYDRYPLAWAVLLPVVWTRELPRWLWILQMIGLVAIAGVFTWTWLL